MRPLTIAAVLAFAMASTVSAAVLDVRELNTKQISALDRAKTVVILPGGILEEHGPFLPAFTDGYQTDFIAARVADAIGARPGWTVLKFPVLPLGANPASDIGMKYSFPGSYPVRVSTLRAVYMDFATDLGDAGFKWIFALNLHGAPTHALAIDDACRYFSETYGGRMVQLTGLAQVAGAVPRDLFTPEQRREGGFSVHADADEHSRLLFLRPDLVDAGIRSAPPVVGRNMADLVTIAKGDGWPGYWGTPAIASAEAGRRGMQAIADAAVQIALRVLEGAPDSALPRVADGMNDPDVRRIMDAVLAHERENERRQAEWLAKQRP